MLAIEAICLNCIVTLRRLSFALCTDYEYRPLQVYIENLADAAGHCAKSRMA